MIVFMINFMLTPSPLAGFLWVIGIGNVIGYFVTRRRKRNAKRDEERLGYWGGKVK